MKDKRKKILDMALQLFNAKGIDMVTTRDIAHQINISLGNMTYYFPTKNDIIFALFADLTKAIDEALRAPETGYGENTLFVYYKQAEAVLYTQLKYKFLFVRWGEIVSSSPDLQKGACEFLKVRFDSWQQVHIQLVKEKIALPGLKTETHGVSHLINMLAIFWHQEFAMYYPKLDDKQKVKLALSVIFQTYKPYLTPKGLKMLAPLQKKFVHY